MIPIPEFPPRKVDMSPEAIDLRLREVAQLHQLGILLGTAKRLGTVAEVRERERLEAEAANDGHLMTTNTPLKEDSPR